MDFTFSFGWFFFGIVIVIAGILLARFYKEIADNFGAGVVSYDRYKLVAVITVVVGILIMLNLHILVLTFITSLIVPNK
ncbi:MAG: hypothetical protein LBG75_02235 [Candidatus Nomurabacteria bacterium]|jgi:hypothetical protein|nr:hypothetical protein [Candidatus Nomurabacteria bacterium]